MSDLISRKSLLNKIDAYVVGSQDKEFICKLIKEMSSEDINEEIQDAYCRGKIDGVKECTAKLERLNEKLANKRTKDER